MAATLKVPTIFTAVDKTTSVLRTMRKSVGRFGREGAAAIRRLDQKLSGTLKKMGRFSQLALGLGIGALFTQAIQGNIEFNDSLASVSAITGAVGEDLIKLETNAQKTAKVFSKTGSEVLKAYELVASAKPELLENADALDTVTRSVIKLSQASRLDLEQSSLSLTAVMNQFGLGAEMAADTVDRLAAGAKFGAATIPNIAESIVQFGTGAAASNVSLNESVALVELFAAKGIKGAESGTKLRNILTKMSASKAIPKKGLAQLAKFGVNLDLVSDKTVPLMTRLKEMSKISGDATALVKVFGLENKEAAQILLNNLPLYDELNQSIREQGVADQQAAANTNTLKFALQSIKTAFINATTASNGNSKSLETVKKALFFVSENMDTVVVLLAAMLSSYLALKVATGIITAVEIATKVWTAAQWGLNAAMYANPIGLVIGLIALLIGLIYTITANFNDFGAALGVVFSGLGILISPIKALQRNWESLEKTFSTEGIIAGVKELGLVLLDSLFQPFEQFWTLLSKVPLIGGLAKQAAINLGAFRNLIGVDTSDREGENPELETTESPEALTGKIIKENITKNNIDINIKDPGNNVEGVDSSGDIDIPVTVTQTQGAS